MTEEQIEHIKTLLAHEDTTFIQQGLTLLETEITSAETLCTFFGIEASNGFNPIAEQIVEWTHSSMVVAWLEQLAMQHDIGFIKDRSRRFRMRINRGWQITYAMAELTREGYEFWSQSDVDLDAYIEGFDTYPMPEVNIPAEADFCREENWEDDYSLAANLEYENLPIEIIERFQGKRLATLYSGNLFDLVDQGADIALPPEKTYTEIVESTPISDNDTFWVVNYKVWRAGSGYYLDIETESPFDFAKLLVNAKFDTTLGATILSYDSGIEYDDFECTIEVDGSRLERSKWICTRITKPRESWKIYSHS